MENPIDQKTNFFTLLHSLLGDGLDLTLTFKRDKQGGGPTGASRLIVGVRPQYSDDKDHPVNMLRPILLTHDPDKLDEAFFITLTTPLANVRELAAQVEEFNKEVSAAKETVSKKKEGQKSKPSTTAKKAAPVKKAAPAKVVKPKAEPKPKVSKEDREKEKNQKQAKAFMGYAEGHAKKAKYKEALINIDKALKLDKDKAYVEERERIINLMEDVRIKKEKEDAEKKVAPLLLKAEALAKSMNYGELGHTLFDIFKVSPDNVKANAIKTKLIGDIGEDPVKKLIRGR